MRILNLVAGEKWTGAAAVVFEQTGALVQAGIEIQFGFVQDSPLAERLLPLGWARPLFERPPRWPVAYLRDVRKLRATIQREKFNIIHTHTSHDHHVAAWAIAGTRVALVRTIHHVRHARQGLGQRWLSSRTRAFAFANTEVARAFGATGPIHPPIVDTERFHPAPKPIAVLRRFGLPEGKFLVGTVGKVDAGRGHAEAITAVARASEPVWAVHVGHGEWMSRLKKLAASLNATDRNLWTGYQEGMLPDLYRSMDAFLFTASGSDQGQRAILEAMASGLPIVALDLPGVRDLVTDGKEGFVVKRIGELSDRLGQLARSAELRAEMSAQAIQRAGDFTGEKFVKKVLPFYKHFGVITVRR
jgi:glycosyltransferase involved in cell wall biosynthesis